MTPNIILQLHKNLYKYSASSNAGKFKSSDNFIEEEDEYGKKRIRFKLVSAFETPMSIQELCDSYNKEIQSIFFLDF